ncbi:hypothetical protein MMC09_005519 [Bachmanniomyces sp. S44760]|nr:hypothetical protein [Bachmanniomyces sp. S44760]
MKTSIVIAVSSLLAFAAAAKPHTHRHHHAGHREAKRDIVWVTVVDEVIVTVDEYTTVWVDGGASPATTADTTTSTTTSSTSSATSTTSTSSTSSISQAPAQNYQAPAAVPTTMTTSTTPVQPSPTYVAPPVNNKVEQPPPPPQQPAAASTPKDTSNSGSGGSGGSGLQSSQPGSSVSDVCTKDAPCSGIMSNYDPSGGVAGGLGSCGYAKSNSDLVVAVTKEMMGTVSNGNPMCGKMVTVVYGETSVVAMVADKCPLCVSLPFLHTPTFSRAPDLPSCV